MPFWTLRAADAGDTEFQVRLYASTRLQELSRAGWSDVQVQLFLRSQFEMQDRHYRSHFSDARFDIVQIDGHDAGRMVVVRSARQWQLVDMALLPEFRGRGLGMALLRALTDEAAANGQSVLLHVERTNPAQRLYRRLGFVDVAEHGLHIEMCWSAPQARSAAGSGCGEATPCVPASLRPNALSDYRQLETLP